MTQASVLPHRRDIQGLRAIAVAMVVVTHAGATWLRGGFIGVDLFFVLSGYLITGLLIREYEDTGTIRLTRFFARRLKRLLPALLVMLILVILAATLVLSSYEASVQSASLVFAATWTSNFFFAFSTIDYFNELQVRDLFLHTWSLGVEEQFYLIWPLLLIATLSLATKLSDATRRHRAILAAFVLLAAISLGLSWYWTSTQPMWSFYLMPARIWQFALGGAVSVLLGDGRIGGRPAFALPTLVFDACGASGLLMIVVSAFLFSASLVYPGWWALLPSLGAALVIASGVTGETSGISKMLKNPAMVWLGDRSYSWYLWHWPLLMIGEALGVTARPLGTIALVLFSLMLADLSYRWVEQPFWKGRFSHASAWRTLQLSILGMLLMIACATRYVNQFQPSDTRVSGPISAARKARIDVPVIYAQGCDTWYHDARVVPCANTTGDTAKTVVLFGDSIGAQWYSLLPEIFKAPEWRVIVLTKSACAMVDEDFFYPRIGKVYAICSEWRSSALSYLESIRPDVVFVGNSSVYEFTEKQWIEGSARVIARLSAVANRIVVLPGTPALPFDGPACLDRVLGDAPRPKIADLSICSAAPADNRYVDVTRFLATVVSKFENVHLLDLNEQVCPKAICSAQAIDGTFVFRDSQHLTDTFVHRQIPAVVEQLAEIGLVRRPSNPSQKLDSAANAL